MIKIKPVVFPSPIGESIFQICGCGIVQIHRREKFPSPIGESIFQIITESAMKNIYKGFRPLSGNLYFKYCFAHAHQIPTFTGFRPLSGNLYFKFGKFIFFWRIYPVSVPYRGIYISNDSKQTRRHHSKECFRPLSGNLYFKSVQNS